VRILYLSLSYVPSRRASSVQVMKMCSALARRGHEVVLIAKQGDEPVGDDHAFYAVEPNFVVDKIARPTRRGGGLVYGAGLAARLARRYRWADLVYCRDPVGGLLAAEARLPVVFEAHELPSSRWLHAVMRRMASRSLAMVAITRALRDDLVAAKLGGARDVIVAPDAYDSPSTPARRRPVGQPPMIGYVGNLYAGRGVELIVELAKVLPDCRFRVVGGSQRDVARWRALGLPRNLEMLGFRPQAELPAVYAGLDVVLMPHSSRGVVGATGTDITRWTSPMKMFEYMASGVPMVASDLPVLREVLRDGDNALIARADDVDDWRRAIDRLVSDDDLRFQIGTTAQRDIERDFTWDARAKHVMTSLGFS
jgi:glycosyltransferase involved in cell wall biosynthesis